jgi:hypothetical protein
MDLAGLRAAFAGRLCEHADAVTPLLTDRRRKWTGRAIAVAQPDNAKGVAPVLRRDESVRCKPAVELRLMPAVRQALDLLKPMNPGKLLVPSRHDAPET